MENMKADFSADFRLLIHFNADFRLLKASQTSFENAVKQ